MNLCERCRTETEDSTNWPVFSIGGGATGLLAFGVSGLPILVPLSFIAGVVIDVERCSKCGAAMDDENTLYRPMYGEDDATGCRTFASPRSDTGTGRSQIQGPKLFQPTETNRRSYEYDNTMSKRNLESNEPMDFSDQPEGNNNGIISSLRYTWDQLTSTFIPTEQNEDQGTQNMNDIGGPEILLTHETHNGILDEEIDDFDAFDTLPFEEPDISSLDTGFDDPLQDI